MFSLTSMSQSLSQLFIPKAESLTDVFDFITQSYAFIKHEQLQVIAEKLDPGRPREVKAPSLIRPLPIVSMIYNCGFDSARRSHPDVFNCRFAGKPCSLCAMPLPLMS